MPQPDNSVGYPHPQVQLRLVDGGNRDADQGVLEMKCPALMNGYHNRPDVPTPFTADGFYITGDVFRRDDDGFHYFVGRTDDMFVSGGENIYPTDVERMLEKHPDVGAGGGGAGRRRHQGHEAGRFRHSEGRARAPTEDGDQDNMRWPTRRPTSTRALSGSWTNCRSPRPTRSTATPSANWPRSASPPRAEAFTGAAKVLELSISS